MLSIRQQYAEVCAGARKKVAMPPVADNKEGYFRAK
jgi:hypothetical protein